MKDPAMILRRVAITRMMTAIFFMVRFGGTDLLFIKRVIY
jgi:hypothetical protein